MKDAKIHNEDHVQLKIWSAEWGVPIWSVVHELVREEQKRKEKASETVVISSYIPQLADKFAKMKGKAKQ